MNISRFASSLRCLPARCGCQVVVCGYCDRGQIYCDGDCSRQARRQTLHGAGRRWQRTPHGRRMHPHSDSPLPALHQGRRDRSPHGGRGQSPGHDPLNRLPRPPDRQDRLRTQGGTHAGKWVNARRAAPDLLAMRRAAMARGMIGRLWLRRGKQSTSGGDIACRSRLATPCSLHVRRHRSGSRRDPRCVRAERRAIGCDRVAPAVSRHHEQPAGAGVCPRHCRMDAVAASTAQAASGPAPGALKRSGPPERALGRNGGPHPSRGWPAVAELERITPDRRLAPGL